MGETSIEWTHYTFNPWRGCTKVSAGCAHCYAETMSRRNPAVLGEWGPDGKRVLASEEYWRQPDRWNARARREGRRFRVFCGSLMDVFEDRPELVEHRRRLFKLIAYTPQLDWLLLTKRPENIVRLWPGTGNALAPMDANGNMPHVWLGTSISTQEDADRDVPLLLQTPAALRFVSLEPLLGPVDLTHILVKKSDAPERGKPDVTFDALHGWYGGVEEERTRLDWVIVGGESGPGRRPMDLAWLEAVDRQTREARVPLFVKQDNGTRPGRQGRIPDSLWARKEMPL